jgi:hypothetical protein
LRNGLTDRARELVGDRVLKTDKIALSLGIDGALNKGQVRVQAIWDEDSPKTQVTARKKKPAIPESEAPFDPQLAQSDDSDRTVVRPRAPLFTVQYTIRNEPEMTFIAHKNRIEIGRGSKDFFVDLKLEGDQEISRKHAILTRGENGSFKLECVGRNSIEADGREIQPGGHLEVKTGQTIQIGVYKLKIAE